ncbi:exonuclease domain-containing protein [Alteromonas sp. ASW11-36]|uniref:DNA-directed DNA polymerase n=1 Tax=Alteromonas arenosi TaxID=3055817 RepID=A0ABT7T176_9ALTE|nr:exonuclease domain-containing protein [Alteromonas sp. ASW11-36]MDM7862206.1 exonuclease domain-containing protein [Alteromonas sp. ASW11-36]
MKQLPTFYYLDHFREFLQFVEGPSGHLLNRAQRNWISLFGQLDKWQQCVVARCANRKYPLIKKQSLEYEEIPDSHTHVAALLQQGFLRPPQAEDVITYMCQLTKPELLSGLREYSTVKALASRPKAALLAMAIEHIDTSAFAQSDVMQAYVFREFDHHLQYFLFLFFGHLRGTLSQFSMRDLGVMRTRRDSQNNQAHFEDREAAESAFYYAQLRSLAKHQGTMLNTPENLADLPPAHGHLANRYRDEYLYLLGKHCLADGREFAMSALAASNADIAREKWLRELYKDGDKESVEQHLLDIINNPPSEELLVFAEDFLARKFHKKKTSRMTDLLAQANNVLNIDEVHINRVEAGVMAFYRRSEGVICFRTENHLWLSLFGLVFWDIIYDIDSQALSNEFDIRPKVLLEDRLYQDHGTIIEQRLESWQTPHQLLQFIVAQSTQHYGKINTLFQWHSDLLTPIKGLLTHSKLESVKAILLAMTQSFKALRDGFPDIMVIANGQLRFEEIKAPGDSLRRNQLVSLDKLKSCGFDVRITKVQWCRDPMQPYAVVDIETTGGRSSFHRITEIGIVKMINGEAVATWQTLINPQRNIPNNITALTGIDNSMVADAPIFAEIADDLQAFTEGCIFVAHNVNFDYGFIRQEYERLDRNYRRPKLCTCADMRKAVPGLRSYSLANLTAHFGIEMDRHHRALSDAKAAAELLKIIHQH